MALPIWDKLSPAHLHWPLPVLQTTLRSHFFAIHDRFCTQHVCKAWVATPASRGQKACLGADAGDTHAFADQGEAHDLEVAPPRTDGSGQHVAFTAGVAAGGQSFSKDHNVGSTPSQHTLKQNQKGTMELDELDPLVRHWHILLRFS